MDSDEPQESSKNILWRDLRRLFEIAENNEEWSEELWPKCPHCGHELSGSSVRELLDEMRDEVISMWHDSDSRRPLHEHLGMTEPEYAAWVEQKPVKGMCR
jgi:hypothetical protein